jgi:RHS repeat-associated protein
MLWSEYWKTCSPNVPPPPTPPDPTCNTCPCPDGTSTKNPILPASAEKFRQERDIALEGPHPLSFERVYRSSRVGGGTKELARAMSVSMSTDGSGSTSGGPVVYLYQEPSIPPMGQGWTTNFIARLKIDPYQAHLSFGGGQYRSFGLNATTLLWLPTGAHKDRLTAVHPDGVLNTNSVFTYQAAESDSKLVFKVTPSGTAAGKPVYQGLLSQIVERNGWTAHIEIDPASPPDALRSLQVTNHFGRQLRFSYTPAGQISAVTSFTAAGEPVAQVQYSYDTGARLTRVTYPNGDYRDFHYEDSRNANWLTGYSVNGQRTDTYTYDANGLAIATAKAGNVSRYAVDYSAGSVNATTGIYNSTKITDPLGTQRTYGYSVAGNKLNVTSASLVGADGNADPIASRTVDNQGMVTRETTFKGAVNSRTIDPTRQLPTAIGQGSGLKTQTITWHPKFRLPLVTLEGDGTQTVNTYDANGNLTQRDVTKAGDVASSRTWKYTYNAAGLLETETDPRGGVSTYAYDALGQLISSKNPRNHTTTYGFDAAGRVNRITQPNGLIQRFVYNPRGWVTRQTQAAGGVTLVTDYTYEPSGQVKTASLPNGHFITYQFDAAERLVGWSDNRGQSAAFTLDAMGNATQQTLRNSNGQTAYTLSTEINAINRVQSQTVGGYIVERQTQDANGNLASVTDAANRSTTLGRDALDRVTTVTNAAAKTATLAYNAQDSVTAATDFKGVKTTFTRDAQGNAREEQSPDIGTTRGYYNGLELPTRVVDAMGRASAITRDVLGRPIRIVHRDNRNPSAPELTTLLRYDLAGDACNAPGHPRASKGQLCEMEDQASSPNGPFTQAFTQYQWDSFGHLTRQTQTLSSAIASHSLVQTTAYSYVASGPGAGQLASLTYPSGAVLTHAYDTTGRLSAMALDGQPLLADIRFNALEQPLSWAWAFATHPNGLKAERTYDTAGQLRQSTGLGGFVANNRGQIVRLNQRLFQPDPANPAANWSATTVPYSAQYNVLGQLTSFDANADVAANTPGILKFAYTYQYDANGNRRGGSIALGDGIPVPYDNALFGVKNHQRTAAGIDVATNAAGDVTSLLGKAIAYDAAGRVSQVTAIPPCPSGLNCSGPQTTLSRYNGHNQRYLRDNSAGQTVFTYAPDGYSVLAEVQHTLIGATTVSNTLENVYLPTASGPLPVVALINGAPFAVYADHLNTPRRLTDAQGRVRWQWAFSGFGEQAAQSIPRNGLPTVTYSLRYPGQVDDGNGLFYNFNRFYDPLAGRYTSADPIGLDGGWNRFGYVGGNALSNVDPMGLQALPVVTPPPPPAGPIGGGTSGGWNFNLDRPAANDPSFGGGGGGGGPGCDCEELSKTVLEFWRKWNNSWLQPELTMFHRLSYGALYTSARTMYEAECGPWTPPSAPKEPPREQIDDFYSR